MKRFLLPLLSLLPALSAWAAPSFVGTPTIGGSPATTAGLAFDVLDPPAIRAAVQGASWVRAEVWQGAVADSHSAVHVYLSSSGGNVWTGTMPVNHAGTTWVLFTAGDNDGAVVSSSTAPYYYEVGENYDNPNALGQERRPLFTSSGPWFRAWEYTGTVNSQLKSGTAGGWKATAVRMPVARFLRLRATRSSSPGLHSQVSTIDELAAGTIWFKARNAGTEQDVTLVVERIVGTTRTTIQEIYVPARQYDTDVTWTQYQIVVQDGTEGSICIRNATRALANSDASKEASAVDITDIVITPPQPDVQIIRREVDFEPGFPSVQDPMTFRIAVSNLYDAAQAANVTPKLVWRQNGGGWKVSAMTNVLGRAVQGDGEYAITLTDHVAGSFEYFFRADFAGYTPTFERVNPAVLVDIKYLRWNNAGDRISFGKGTAGTETVFVDEAGDESVQTTDGLAALSRSPAYSVDFQDLAMLPEHGAMARYVYRYDSPVIGEWELSHRFDIENLDEGWPKTVADCSEDVELEAEYPYSTLRAADGVRRFRSLYGTLEVEAADHPSAEAPSHLAPSYPMQQVGDYTWQAIIRLTNAVDAALSIRGTDQIYVTETGAYAFDPGPFDWGEVNQEPSSIYPPMSGALTIVGPGAERPEGWDPVHMSINYNGFLMFRYCTTNGSYQIRRAAWQDFNGWQADDLAFARSFGLYNTKTWENDVDALEPTVDAQIPFLGLENSPVSPSMLATTYADGLLANNAWIVAERMRDNRTNYASTAANRAWRLSTAENFPGALQTTLPRVGRGSGTLTFRARAATDDDRAVLYTGNSQASDWANLRVAGHATTTSLSDGLPSISVYGYWQDPNNYWEARLTQTNLLAAGSTAANSHTDSLMLQIFVRENGVLRQVGATKRWDSNNNALLTRSGGVVLVLDLTTSGGQVRSRAYVLNGATFTSSPANEPARLNSNLGLELSAQSSTVTHGTVGFNSRDCEATIAPYVFRWNGGTTTSSSTTDESVRANGSNIAELKAVSTAAPGEWTTSEHDGKTVYAGPTPWDITGGSNSATQPTKFIRKRHAASYRLKVYRTASTNATDFLAPVPSNTKDWTTSWDVLHGHNFDVVFTVDSYAWRNVEIPLWFWDDTYLMLEALPADKDGNASTAMLQLDDFALNEWLGQTVWHEDFGNATQNARESWQATWATVERDGRTGRRYVLDRTRAARTAGAAGQYLQTPWLENGVGDILFSYRAESAPVMFTVSVERGAGNSRTLAAVTADVSSVSSSLYVPCLEPEAGRLRIETQLLRDGNGNELFGTLALDNLRATDYPNDPSTAWEAYNLLVSTFRSSPAIMPSGSSVETLQLKFDGPTDPADYRSAVLNDGNRKDTVQDLALSDANPYLQTPQISTGVGEVSFWYRASPDNPAGTSARLRLMVSESGSSPLESDWRQLTAADLNPDSETYEEQKAALRALDTITTDTWTYFSAEFFQQDYRVLRIFGTTNGANRVMVDNVLITEPVRSSIDVGRIEFTPDIPLCTSDTDVKVQLVNPRMNPHDISVRLDYYVGTNLWGYNAWKDNPTGSIQMTNAVPGGYTFASVEPIPHGNVDDVVQYCAVVNYRGTFASPIASETQARGTSNNVYWFENPSWYDPTDLNKTFGTTNRPVSHYWVFSCTTNVVWINEYRTTVNSVASQANQFVELIGPEGADISNWRLEHYGYRNSVWTPSVCTYTNVMVSGATFQPANNGTEDKGWGFWILGCYGVNPALVNQELFTEEDARSSDFNDHPYLEQTGGALRLRRSMGADVDRIVWADTKNSASDFMAAGYPFTVYNNRTTWSVSKIGSSEGTLQWTGSSSITTGGYNFNEEDVLPKVDAVEPPVVEEKALLAQPVVTAFAFDGDDAVEITFSVSVTNGIALDATSGWTWVVEESADVSANGWIPNAQAVFPAAITAPADGTPSVWIVRVPVSARNPARFYRIRATKED